MDWVAIATAAGIVIGALGKWATDAHARRKGDHADNIELLRELIDTLRRDLRHANERVEVLQAAEARCREEMAAVKQKLAALEAEIARLKRSLGEA